PASSRCQSRGRSCESGRCNSYQLEAALVRRWPIDRRHGNIEQTQIDAKLSAMMDQVVHYEAAHHGRARQREDWFTTVKQRPLPLPVFISAGFKRRSRRSNVLVKRFKYLSAGLCFWQTIGRLARRRNIQFISIKRMG